MAHAITVDGSQITRSGHGVRVSNRASVAISNSLISINNAIVSSAAVLADSAVVGGAIIDLENCEINNNSVGVQANANQAIRLSNTHMTANGNALISPEEPSRPTETIGYSELGEREFLFFG